MTAADGLVGLLILAIVLAILCAIVALIMHIAGVPEPYRRWILLGFGLLCVLIVLLRLV